MCFSNPGDGGAAAAERKAETKRENAITTGEGNINNAFSSFNDDYYNNESSAYSAYEDPLVQQQYDDAKKQLVFSLSRTGNLNSTAAADANRKLLQQLSTAQQTVASNANNFVNQQKQSVAQSQANLESQLTATEDPVAAGTSAINEADRLAAPPVFTPIGNLFSSVTGTLDNALNNANTGYTGAQGVALYGNGNSSAGSGKVVG